MHPIFPVLIPLLLLAFPANAASRSFTVGPFERVTSSGSADVFVTTGPTVAVIAEGPQERLDRLKVEVVGGELRLREESRTGFSWGRSQGVVIRIVAPALKGAATLGSGTMTIEQGAGDRFDAKVAGSGDLRVARIDAPALAVEVLGSGNATLGRIAAREARFSVMGSGNVEAVGAAASVRADIAGSGNLEITQLRAQDVRATVAGTGNLKAFASGSADLSVSGSGNAVVRGGPRCTVRKSGSGEARCTT
jgi:carbon monoxide dehydrogenase subunit G